MVMKESLQKKLDAQKVQYTIYSIINLYPLVLPIKLKSFLSQLKWLMKG
nr:MAG TPA: hypothetical protein [Caudoviricetes sp.]